MTDFDREAYIAAGRVIFGHELWFDKVSEDFRNDVFVAELGYGHRMVHDKIAPPEYLNIFAFDADGKALEVNVEALEDRHKVTFKGNGNAPYTLYNSTDPTIWNVINDGSWTKGAKKNFQNVATSSTYNMYAKIVFSEGDATTIDEEELEIIPDAYSLTVGKEVSFTILYEGRPLAKNRVVAYNRNSKEEVNLVTGADGKCSFTVEHPGDWMILSRHKDETKCQEDEFDETVYVATLVMSS